MTDHATGTDGASWRPTGSAARMRRLRKRRRAGTVLVRLFIPPWAIAELVDLGWLEKGAAASPPAVRDAFIRSASHALVVGLRAP